MCWLILYLLLVFVAFWIVLGNPFQAIGGSIGLLIFMIPLALTIRWLANDAGWTFGDMALVVMIPLMLIGAIFGLFSEDFPRGVLVAAVAMPMLPSVLIGAIAVCIAAFALLLGGAALIGGFVGLLF